MSTRLVLATLLGAGAVAAAGAGGYIALRHNAVERETVPVATSTVVVEPQAEARPDVAQPKRTVTKAPKAPVNTPRDQPVQRPAQQSPSVTNVPASDPAPASQAPVPTTSEPVRPDPGDAFEPAAAPVFEPVRPRIEELTIPTDAVIGIRLESSVSSEDARVEDTVTARVSRDLTVDGQTAISSGSRLEGVVASVDRGGKFKDRARVGLRFQSLVLGDGTRLPVETEMIFRESGSPTGSAASKVGAIAAVGGILGAVIGGKKGAAIGAAVGAAGGSGVVMAGSGATAIFSAGAPLTVRLTAPVTVQIQREH